jgi:hypothetical protein
MTVDQARAQTGFELVISDRVSVTVTPSAEELHRLRTHVDRDGLLRHSQPAAALPHGSAGRNHVPTQWGGLA